MKDNPLFKPPFTYDAQGGYICNADSVHVLEVRGWGHLIALLDDLYMSGEVATKQQDEFAQYVINLLNQQMRIPS